MLRPRGAHYADSRQAGGAAARAARAGTPPARTPEEEGKVIEEYPDIKSMMASHAARERAATVDPRTRSPRATHR